MYQNVPKYADLYNYDKVSNNERHNVLSYPLYLSKNVSYPTVLIFAFVQKLSGNCADNKRNCVK